MTKYLFYKVINFFRTVYWFIFRPKTQGVKCLIEHGGKFLMIRNSYGYKQWTFPGGGVSRGELPEEAIRREIYEEVGIEVGNPIHIGEYFSSRQYKQDTVFCYYAKVRNEFFQIDNGEVSEAAWFSEKEMPELRSSIVDKILKQYKLKLKLD